MPVGVELTDKINYLGRTTADNYPILEWRSIQVQL